MEQSKKQPDADRRRRKNDPARMRARILDAAFALFHGDSTSDAEPQPVATDMIEAKPAASAS